MLERLWREKNLQSLLVGTETGAATVEKSMEFPQKINNRVTILLRNTFSMYLPEKFENTVHKDICIPMFIAALFTVTKTWRQQRCPLLDDWVKEMWYIYTTEYYSTMRKDDEIMSFEPHR